MVRLLEELPPELQAHIAGTLVDAAAPGRWAQACRASRLPLLPRLDELLEVRRYARQQAVLSRPRRGSAAAHSVYDMGNGDAAIHVLPRNLDSFICACCTGDRVHSIGHRFGCTNVLRLPSSIGQANASRFTVWTLMRPPGTRLRQKRPHSLTCSREQRKNSGGGACGRLYNLL